jgi:hypothetical protein
MGLIANLHKASFLGFQGYLSNRLVHVYPFQFQIREESSTTPDSHGIVKKQSIATACIDRGFRYRCVAIHSNHVGCELVPDWWMMWYVCD